MVKLNNILQDSSQSSPEMLTIRELATDNKTKSLFDSVTQDNWDMLCFHGCRGNNMRGKKPQQVQGQ